jgi:2-oxoglutarate ferredoxin oxidoreductase subunit beta
MTSKTAPYAYLEDPLNPVAMFLGYDVSFIARGFSGKPKVLKELFIKAIQHRGFAIVHIFSPCVTMNKQITFNSMKEIVKELPEDHDPANRLKAMEYALDEQNFWTGVFYRKERPTLQDRLDHLEERAGRYKDLNELMTRFK